MKIEMWDIDRPVDYVRNARKITAQAADKVAASIQEFGFRQCLVVDRDGVICIGHVRRRAAKKLGMPQVPVHVAADLTPGQIKALRLMDNRSHDEVQWDLELLGPELLDLQAMHMDLSLSGFELPEIDRLLHTGEDPRADELLPVPEHPVTRAGDLWLCGQGRRPHRVLCADATQPEAVARLLAGQQPLLMVTDPPFGISLDSEWRDRAVPRSPRTEPIVRPFRTRCPETR
jgi:hypothetical protein